MRASMGHSHPRRPGNAWMLRVSHGNRQRKNAGEVELPGQAKAGKPKASEETFRSWAALTLTLLGVSLHMCVLHSHTTKLVPHPAPEFPVSDIAEHGLCPSIDLVALPCLCTGEKHQLCIYSHGSVQLEGKSPRCSQALFPQRFTTSDFRCLTIFSRVLCFWFGP